MTNGQSGSADITFGFTKVLKSGQDGPLAPVAQFKIVATQAGSGGDGRSRLVSERRVVLVEDHVLLAETLCAALSQRGIDAAVAQLPGSLTDLLTDLLLTLPDLVLLDLHLGELGTSESLVAPLTAAGVDVLVVTGSTDRLAVAAALDSGAIGWQSKTAGFDALVAATAAALTSRSVPSPDREDLLAELREVRPLRERVQAAFAALTERESATLGALRDGRTVHEIASDWVVSEATVRSHVRGVLVKLGVTSQLAAVARSHQAGWPGRA